MTHEPATKEIKYLLPKTALSLREPRPQQWSNMVQQAWNNVQHSSAATCKAQVLGELTRDFKLKLQETGKVYSFNLFYCDK